MLYPTSCPMQLRWSTYKNLRIDGLKIPKWNGATMNWNEKINKLVFNGKITNCYFPSIFRMKIQNANLGSTEQTFHRTPKSKKNQLSHGQLAAHKFVHLNVYFSEARNWIDCIPYNVHGQETLRAIETNMCAFPTLFRRADTSHIASTDSHTHSVK